MQNVITVVIVDDHDVVRQGVRAILGTQAEMRVVAEGASGSEAVALCAAHGPDVLLIDLLMPGLSSIEAIRAVKVEHAPTQIIVLTSYHTDDYILPAFRAGALSYLLKDVSPAELIQAVRHAASGEAVLNPKVAGRLVDDVRTRAPVQPGALLSERELEVLRLIADGNANAEIAALLTLSEKTVKGHVSNILSKLHLVDRTQAAIFAWREGLVK